MRSRRLSSEERRGQIARVAAELFARKGFSGVTTRQIARRARVNEAIVFRHFPTKSALFTEIINQKIHIELHLIDPELIDHGDDAKVLTALAEFMIRQAEDDPTFLRLLLYSALEDHELANVFMSERTCIVFDFLLKFVQKRVKQGRFRRVHAGAAVRAFVGMLFNYILTEEIFDMPVQVRITRDQAIATFVEIFLEGLRKKECAA